MQTLIRCLIQPFNKSWRTFLHFFNYSEANNFLVYFPHSHKQTFNTFINNWFRIFWRWKRGSCRIKFPKINPQSFYNPRCKIWKHNITANFISETKKMKKLKLLTTTIKYKKKSEKRYLSFLASSLITQNNFHTLDILRHSLGVLKIVHHSLNNLLCISITFSPLPSNSKAPSSFTYSFTVLKFQVFIINVIFIQVFHQTNNQLLEFISQ